MNELKQLTDDQLIGLLRSVLMEATDRKIADIAQSAILDEAEKSRIAQAAATKRAEQIKQQEAERVARDAESKIVDPASLKAREEDRKRREHTLETVTMQDGSQRLKFWSNGFVPGFSDDARALGGNYNKTANAWYFDVRDESRVRDLLTQYFGLPGEMPATMRIHASALTTTNEFWVGGRCIASRRFRDGRVNLGANVVVVAGSFSASGGSSNYPRLSPSPDLILEVRDVPRSIAITTAALANQDSGHRTAASPVSTPKIEVLL
jgi:hypothetical protein